MPRGKPFQKGASGNPSGKRRGTRHKTTVAIEELFDGEAEALTRKAIEKALDGDMVAMRICFERIVPARKDRPIAFDLRPIETAADASAAMSDILSAVAAGRLTPIEAGEVCKIIEAFTHVLETNDFEHRLRALEGGGLTPMPEKRR